MRSWTSVRALPADAVVMQYDYNGEVVYYFPSPCCDQYNYVYNRECEVICAPDGGITGAGDQHCTDFFDEAKNGVVLLKHGEEIK